MTTSNAVEQNRELLVRTISCPSCGRKPHKPCGKSAMAHTARYNAAAEQGLVSALRPIPSMEVWCECHC